MPILYSEIGFETAETDFCFGRNLGHNGLFTVPKKLVTTIQRVEGGKHKSLVRLLRPGSVILHL